MSLKVFAVLNDTISVSALPLLHPVDHHGWGLLYQDICVGKCDLELRRWQNSCLELNQKRRSLSTSRITLVIIRLTTDQVPFQV